jgi:tubulin polyglutamylase TTLL6/13
MIIQKYIQNPMLIQGLKFDLRIYVLVVSVDPLVIYIYKNGLTRLATETYKVC